jgi:hypothetical protein
VLSLGDALLPETHTYRVSKIINAPLRFVFDWCTDFREDDNQITGSKTKRKIVLKTKRRVVYISIYERDGRNLSGVNIVTLNSPKAWHLEYLGEEDDEIGGYKLKRLGPRRTRLDMTFTEKYKISNAPTKEEDRNQTEEMWDRYVVALERDFSSSD